MTRRDQKKVLVVDDDLGVVLALAKRLREVGFQVQTATSGTDAFRFARAGGIDAITLDVGLWDDVDGLDVASVLSREPDTSEIPIIFITGRADSEFEERYRDSGGRFFLAKPYDFDVLLGILDRIFAHDELAEIRQVSELKRRQPAH
ncbi:CAI-1 autoinducer sensor kinase/phosphatase CqsS [Phycisphaerae bacterium RAS1]|nr:CAI-1 autoinducer sensor kinase/phosphatase CqsS [Phycisphaerae bacterium RAS1]